MNLIKFSVRRSITVAMFFLGLILFSSVSFSKLSIDLFPEITAPMALVSATYSGASPQEVENMVTKPLEGVLGGVQGMTDIQSVSSHGSSMVMLTMTQGTDMDFATLQIREKVDLVKDMLPDGVSNVMVLKIDVNMMPVMMVGVSGGRDQSEL
ncbi:MAG: efflux RND transporter permease subunit, partial [Clostridiales bacterium]